MDFDTCYITGWSAMNRCEGTVNEFLPEMTGVHKYEQTQSEESDYIAVV
jgi:hypothetical protein